MRSATRTAAATLFTHSGTGSLRGGHTMLVDVQSAKKCANRTNSPPAAGSTAKPNPAVKTPKPGSGQETREPIAPLWDYNLPSTETTPKSVYISDK